MNLPNLARSLALDRYLRSKPVKKLVAGPLTLEYFEGSIWNISDGSEEVIRRIYLVFQDLNWTSRPFVIKDEDWKINQNSFSAKIQLQGTHDAKELSVELEIIGSEIGEISYRFEGKTTQPFLRNRLGLCILHPIDQLAGRACTLTKSDGAIEESLFPEFISPSQPFLNLSGISHRLKSGAVASVNFEGEIFETEDHRNWSDASYKTYCTPISLPFPVQLMAGEMLEQKITVSIADGQRGLPANIADQSALISVAANNIQLPKIGLGLNHEDESLEISEYNGFEDLAIEHLRLSINPKLQVSPAIEKAIKICQRLQLSLDVAITAGSLEELKSSLESICEFSPQIRSFYIFSSVDKATPHGFIAAAQALLGPSSKIVGGTDLYFTELNRNQGAIDFSDQVNFSINPQVHSFDDRTVIQNTTTQYVIAKNAHRLSKGKKVSIGPVTLRPRYNPNATQPEKDVSNTPLPSSVDARQRTWFTEAWTALSLRSIAQADSISTLTYFETLGWRGIRELSSGSKDKSNFSSSPGENFPVWRLFTEIKGYSHIKPTTSSLPESVDCLVVTNGAKQKVILANFSTIKQKVVFSGIDLEPQTLDPESVTYIEITGVENV
jgi:D-apionolactonase